MDHRQTVNSLEAEMKLLRWHKLANESALKAAILRNKQMKRSESSVPRLQQYVNERLSMVIGEERSKDLQVRRIMRGVLAICIIIRCLRFANVTHTSPNRPTRNTSNNTLITSARMKNLREGSIFFEPNDYFPFKNELMTLSSLDQGS